MVNENVVALLEVLEKEHDCCLKLIEVSKNEQRSLVNNNIDDLAERINDMQTAVNDLHELQGNRRELLQQLASSLDVQPEKISLNYLLDKLEGDIAEDLRSKTKNLARTSETLYQINQHTIYLINFSLNLIDRQINAWTDVLTERDGYDEEGKSTDRRSDAKIIEEKV